MRQQRRPWHWTALRAEATFGFGLDNPWQRAITSAGRRFPEIADQYEAYRDVNEEERVHDSDSYFFMEEGVRNIVHLAI